MLTKNFYRMFCGIMSRTKFKTIDASGVESKFPIDFFVTPYAINAKLFNAMTLTGGDYSEGCIISSDTSEPSADDYAVPANSLKGKIEVIYPRAISVGYVDLGIEYAANYSVTNISTSPVTIGSIWLKFGIRNTDSSTNNFLIDHTKLEVPITVQPGESKQITYTIRFNYPA